MLLSTFSRAPVFFPAEFVVQVLACVDVLEEAGRAVLQIKSMLKVQHSPRN